MIKNNLIKFVLIMGLPLSIGACSTPKYYELEPILEVYPTNMNDCKAVVDTEDYINVDCKRRSVNRLTDDVHYNDEPALLTMQALSILNSALEICDNITKEEKEKGFKVIDDFFQKNIVELYKFDENPEFEDEFLLISEKLKGKYDDTIKENECLSTKKMIESYSL